MFFPKEVDLAWPFGIVRAATRYLGLLVAAGFVVAPTVGCDSAGGSDDPKETSENEAPKAQFKYRPQPPESGAQVQFDASSSSDPDGSIASYEWSFGDGATGTGAEATHAFEESVENRYGESSRYEVTLTVTDGDGGTASLTRTVRVQPTNATVNWEQVWGDEFEGEGLPNSSKWYYETGGGGWGNQEQQYYTREDTDNARVEDGHLIIEARKESYEGNNYTSVRLNSEESWTYGRVEIRAKLPEGRGTWPALWMLPDQDTYGDQYWPDNGEIDIMEHVGYDPGVVHGTIHTEAFNHQDNTERGSAKEVPDAPSAFHTYEMEWTPNEIRVFVDGERYFTFRNREQYGWEEWPFDQDFHLLMNIAVGGAWGGVEGIDDDAFPTRMVIDYVRVYKPK